jgi:hypothetical protein
METIPPATNPPSAAAQNLPLDHQPKARFDYVLQASTVNSDNVLLKHNEPNDPRLADTFWWTVGQEVLGSGAGGVIVIPRPCGLSSPVIITVGVNPCE